MKITNLGNGTTTISTPYDKHFVAGIKKIGGAKWIADEKAWSIPTTAVEVARALMREVYGVDDLTDSTAEKVTVKLTFKDEVEATCEAVIVMSKVLARAFGRDSGAKVGEDVIFIEGGVKSGGSVKNWKSIVKEESVAILSNVPRSVFDRTELPYGVAAEIMHESAPDKQSLLEEKARLVKRLEEIESELAKLS